MKYPSILLGAVQSCMKRQSVVEALITSPSVDRDVNFKSSAHTEISIKFIPSVKGLSVLETLVGIHLEIHQATDQYTLVALMKTYA